MHIIDEMTRRRTARRSARTERAALAADLAVYSTPAEQHEIDLIVGRSTAPEAELVRDILDRLPSARSAERAA
jgi:hypothetical protein